MSLVPIVDVYISSRVYVCLLSPFCRCLYNGPGICISLVPIVDVYISARVYVCLFSLL